MYDAGDSSFVMWAVRAYDKRLSHQLGGDWVIVIQYRTGVNCNATHFEVQSLRENMAEKKPERWMIFGSSFAISFGRNVCCHNESQSLVICCNERVTDADLADVRFDEVNTELRAQ